LAGLTHRDRQPEMMDQPGLDAGQHIAALRGLARINRWSGSAGILWPPLRSVALRSSEKPVRVLDLATGGGDVPIRLCRNARRAGLRMEFAACDISDTAIAFAQREAAAKGTPVKFFRLDGLHEPLPEGYDVVTCSLFLHHLDDEQAVSLLQRMAAAA